MNWFVSVDILQTINFDGYDWPFELSNSKRVDQFLLDAGSQLPDSAVDEKARKRFYR